jgi:hypothetical protein
MKNQKTVLLALLCLLSIQIFAQDAFTVNIDRKMSTNSCTMGYLSVNNKALFYTLELPWKNNINQISCIPAGSYNGVLRYDHTDKWRIELIGVPNRGNVQIHVGNYTKQTKGCVLLGENANTNACSVSSSKSAYKKFKKAFYGSETPIQTPNKKIKVVFTN